MDQLDIALDCVEHGVNDDLFPGICALQDVGVSARLLVEKLAEDEVWGGLGRDGWKSGHGWKSDEGRQL